MHKLTDSQRAALLNAAQRDDGAANLAEILKGAAAARVGKTLIGQRLMREAKTKAGMPVWRRDGKGRTFCLVISSTGRKAVGVFKEPAKALDPAPGKAASIAAWIEPEAATWVVGALPPMVTVTASTDCLPLPAVMTSWPHCAEEPPY